MVRPVFDRRAYPSGSSLSMWPGRDGWLMRRFDWLAEGAPRGSILFQGGRGDIIEKYLETFDHFHRAGWSVTAFDWRGQGGSGRVLPDPMAGHIQDFGIWIDDLADFWEDWAPRQSSPKVLMGHSMGGHLVLRALIEGRVKPDAAVLIAPMLGLHSPFGARMGEWVAKRLGGVGNPDRQAWKQNEIPGTRSPRQKLLTHDLDRYDDEVWWKEQKPELALGPPSWHWVIQAFASCRGMRETKNLKAMTVPLLALIADADKLVDPKQARRLVSRLPDSRIVRFGKESAHEILREVDPVRDRALAEIDLFLSARAQAQ